MGFLVVRPFLFLDLRSVVWFTSSRNGGAATLIALLSSFLSFPSVPISADSGPLAEAEDQSPLSVSSRYAHARGCEQFEIVELRRLIVQKSSRLSKKVSFHR